jgi:tRNA A-37 threonylcarbamoyl transferase component Bud32/tetratricopeptide (TPR) repeat protein
MAEGKWGSGANTTSRWAHSLPPMTPDSSHVPLLQSIRAALSSRYEILEEVGRGGMATVYLARDLKHSRNVAVKVLHPELAAEVGKGRFLTEIRTTANLTHPHILPLFDSGEAEGFLFYVMPFVKGETLGARLERERQLPIEEAVRIAGEIAGALAHAHAEGVIHRDVKPANILLEAGHAVLADFGVAQALAAGPDTRLTKTGVSVGTPTYMSPEQAAGNPKLDGRSDQYALGCVLFEMIAGEPPFTGPTPQAVMAKQRDEGVPPLEILRPEVPGDVIDIVEHALAKLPADRFSSAEQMSEALSQAISSGTGSPGLGKRRRPGRRRPAARRGTVSRLMVAVPWVGLVAVLVMVAIAGWRWIVRSTPHGPDPNKVVVFPLRDLGGGTEEGTDVSYVLYWALEHTHPLKWVEGWRHLSPQHRQNISTLTEAEARAIAGSQGAGYFIDGAVVRRGDSLSVSLVLHDTGGDSTVAEVRRIGHRSQATADHLGLEAMIHLLPPLVDPDRRIDLSYLLDRSPAAIALWIQGEREYRQAHWKPALAFYQRAVAADSNLSFAAIKGAQAAMWAEQPELGNDLAQVALSSQDLLPRKYGAFGQAFVAYASGRADEAVRHSREALAEDPEWAEAWTLLGEIYHHHLPSDLDPDTSAASAFGRAAELDSTFVPPLIHLTEYALQAGDFALADRFIRRLKSVEAPEENVSKLDVMRACLGEGIENLDWREVSGNDTVAVINAADHMTERGTDLQCAEAAYRWVLELGAAEDLTFGAIVGLQGILAMQNRIDELSALLAEGAEITPAAGLYFLLDEFAGAETHEESRAFVDFVRDLTGGTFEGIQPRTQWMIGCWLAYHGTPEDLATVERALTAGQLAGPPEFVGFRVSLAGHRALARGDTTTAMALFGSLPLEATREKLRWDLGGGFPVELIKLAKIHLARGEAREAIRLAGRLEHSQSFSYVPFIAESLRVRHEAAQALGDHVLAAGYRERLIGLGREDLINGAATSQVQGGVG